jgi:hypothetical protein
MHYYSNKIPLKILNTPRALLQLFVAGWLAGQASLSRADQACFAVSPIVLGGVQRTTVCQADIPGLLRANLFPASDKEREKPLVDLSSGVTLTNCLKYYKSAGLRGMYPSRMESYREFRVYMPVCYTLSAVASARRPRASHLPANPLRLPHLPPTLLPGMTSSEEVELKQAEARGETAETYLRNKKRDDPAFDRKAFLEGWQVLLLVRADFDGDGYEDALVRYGYQPEGAHDFGYSLGVLTRKRASETVRWTPFEAFKWRRLPAALRGEKSPGQ